MNNAISFNPQGTSVQFGFCEGFSVYAIEEKDEKLAFTKFKNSVKASNVYLCERLNNSFYVAYVSFECQKRLYATQFSDGIVLNRKDFPSKILRIRVNHERLIVVLESEIHICKPGFDFLKRVAYPSNPSGVVDATESGLLAYPHFDNHGKVVLYDSIHFKALKVISAHEGRVAALQFDANGDLLATASDKGTVIRVFCTKTCDRLFEFCRGTLRTADIFSLAFSADSKFLASTSSTGTLHVFELEDQREKEEKKENEGEEGYFTPYISYLKQQAEIYAPATLRPKSIASCSLPMCDAHRSACVFRVIRHKLHILVATTEGYVFAYRFDERRPSLGLIKQYQMGKPEIAEDHSTLTPFGSD